jgi:hypothetical protein
MHVGAIDYLCGYEKEYMWNECIIYVHVCLCNYKNCVIYGMKSMRNEMDVCDPCSCMHSSLLYGLFGL